MFKSNGCPLHNLNYINDNVCTGKRESMFLHHLHWTLLILRMRESTEYVKWRRNLLEKAENETNWSQADGVSGIGNVPYNGSVSSGLKNQSVAHRPQYLKYRKGFVIAAKVCQDFKFSYLKLQRAFKLGLLQNHARGRISPYEQVWNWENPWKLRLTSRE